MTRTRPLPLTITAALVALEGVVSLVYGVAFLAGFSTAKATLDVTSFLFFALIGAGLLVCAFGLLRLGSWARSPVVLIQLFVLLFAWNVRDQPALAIAPAVVAVGVVVSLFWPSSIRALEPGD